MVQHQGGGTRVHRVARLIGPISSSRPSHRTVTVIADRRARVGSNPKPGQGAAPLPLFGVLFQEQGRFWNNGAAYFNR